MILRLVKFFIQFYSGENSSDADRRIVVGVSYADSGSLSRSVDYLTSSNIQSDMPLVYDKISGNCRLDILNSGSVIKLPILAVRKAYAEIGIYSHGKARAVGTVGERRASIYIRVSQELHSKIYYVLTRSA